ncbi:MAG TPA: four helix bundle protein [Chitinophaga sp.]|uniref:four helix bundle protein n=1 Tax=Chitinophaga sp. TaxID=1869181 RepID=UPI002F924D6F
MKTNIVLDKSYSFSLRIIKLYKYLKKQKEYALALQVLRCGTSIGANTEEAIGASSKKDFKAKLDIAYREARETKYWLRLLKDSDIIECKLATTFITDCEELLKIIGAIQYTFKQRHFPLALPIRNS